MIPEQADPRNEVLPAFCRITKCRTRISKWKARASDKRKGQPVRLSFSIFGGICANRTPQGRISFCFGCAYGKMAGDDLPTERNCIFMKLEKMDEFFAARIDGYDEHMRSNIEGASGFYAYTAELLPREVKSRILDLGCGTGLELEAYFAKNPFAEVTGIDLSEVMLNALKAKFPDNKLNLIQGSYFSVPFGEEQYDGAVSVESLHHFRADMKASLYRKLHTALKDGGLFVLTDYFAESEELEKEYFQILAALKKEQGLSDDEFYHYDTPLLVEHEMDILRQAGFRDVRIMQKWGESTYTVLAAK